MVVLASYLSPFEYKVEWNRLNDATGAHIVNSNLSEVGATARTHRPLQFGRYLSGHGIPVPVVLHA
jgi:hypothetical protein